MKDWVNYSLVIGGGLLVIAELLLGAATGFDLALIGLCLAAGGGLGLLFGSTKVGLFAAGILSFLYLAVLRRWIRSRLSSPDLPSNVDALVGRTAVVTGRIAVNEPGRVKVEDEIWRAVLTDGITGTREPGQTVKVIAVEGVTLRVS